MRALSLDPGSRTVRTAAVRTEKRTVLLLCGILAGHDLTDVLNEPVECRIWSVGAMEQVSVPHIDDDVVVDGDRDTESELRLGGRVFDELKSFA